MRPDRLLPYFAFAYAWTWAIQSLFIATGQPMTAPLGLLLLTLAAVGPSLAAVVVGAATTEASAGQSLPSRLRASLRACWGAPGWLGGPWWLVALFMAQATILVAAGLGLLTGTSAPSARFVPIMVATAVLTGFGEELGWRGFAYSRLVARWERRAPVLGVIWANLSLGVAWALWHLPTAYFPSADGLTLGFLHYVALVIAFSTLTGWVFERAGRRTMIAVLAHAGISLCVVVLPAEPGPQALRLIVTVALAALAGADLVRMRRRRQSLAS
ncbi:CPBP family intramembrane glutamic endopeptidase [Haliangium sp.]|uniref:CPBP family intramembrane glutamic endopeptidase n=1 Tax=Haliangium sp. TaxID=2663208 RepID=UPI003D0C5B57